MPTLLEYPGDELPESLRLQILSFIRNEWPRDFSGPNLFRDWVSKSEDHPVHFVVVEGSILISHAEVVWRPLRLAGADFKVYGLSGVFTYPSHRDQGFARKVVDAGTQLIQRSDGDIAMLWCNPRLKGFYSAYGWLPMEDTVILMGPEDDPIENEELLMMLFLSEKGKHKRETFVAARVYFGLDTW